MNIETLSTLVYKTLFNRRLGPIRVKIITTSNKAFTLKLTK